MLSGSYQKLPLIDTIDSEPWRHPFLSTENIAQFREYSEDVWRHALDVYSSTDSQLDCGFVVNMAQNMHKWAAMATRHGAQSTLYTHPMDGHAFSHPYWELFNGDLNEWNELGVEAADQMFAEVSALPMKSIPLVSEAFVSAAQVFQHRSEIGFAQKDLFEVLSRFPSVRFESLWHHREFATYYDWACELSQHDVCYAASAPFSAYASGVPYAVFSVGADLQIDCGRASLFGQAMSLAFGSARFLMASNPHTLGHSRRLGFTNGVYLPYPMDTNRYSPGIGVARREWEARMGPGIFVLVSSRIDASVKGYDTAMIEELLSLSRATPNLRIVFTGWGADADRYRLVISEAGLDSQVVILPPVGKQKLIDFYRSADVVLDQFVYGYYGTAFLEAASIGKPVVSFLRRSQYDALLRNDSPPIEDATSPTEVVEKLRLLASDENRRVTLGKQMREWVMRNHGEEKVAPLMMALLNLTASRGSLPPGLLNPLCSPITDAEIEYHNSCRVPSMM